MTKKSFIIFIDQLAVLEHLSDEQAGQLLRAMYAWHIALQKGTMDTVELGLDGLMLALFVPFQTQMQRDYDLWINKCEANKENGKLGGRPPKNRKNPSGFGKNPKNPDTDTDTDTDTETETETETDAKRERAKGLSVFLRKVRKEYAGKMLVNDIYVLNNGYLGFASGATLHPSYATIVWEWVFENQSQIGKNNAQLPASTAGQKKAKVKEGKNGNCWAV